MRNVFILTALVLLCVTAGGAPDFPFGPEQSPFGAAAEDPLTFAVLLDRAEVRPGGSFRVAVVLKVEAGWYGYANPKGPGTGKPTVVTGTDRDGFTFSPARYLPGKRKEGLLGPDDWVYGYTGEVPVFLEVTVSPSVEPGTYELGITADALVCKQSCIPVMKNLTVQVTVAEGDAEPAVINTEVFADFDRAKPAPAGAETSKQPVAPPGTDGGDDEADVDITRYEPRSLGDVTGLLMAAVFGFIAGVILNVMPCVLPVISIKILGLVTQAHDDRRKIFLHGLAFAAGIITVFLVLATLGAVAGKFWNEFFQSETFLIIMIGVVFVFALGLFDVYVITVSGRGEAAGSFFKGVLTTFLATPCSGPFLGATVAWLATQPPATIFTVFTTIGLGMASPYVLLSAFPQLLKFVPKPGPWMETFKNLMGFLLIGTVVYLCSILREEILVPTLGFCLLLGIGAYFWGHYAHSAVPIVKRWIWRWALIIFAAGSAWFCYAPSSGETIEWEPFSLTALDLYGLEERTVILDFTADWCPNCKAVEKLVLESESVRAGARKKNAVFMKADLTRSGKDSPEVRLRNQLRSRTIPLLAIFPGDDHYRPFILRDVYTRGAVLAILEECPDA